MSKSNHKPNWFRAVFSLDRTVSAKLLTPVLIFTVILMLSLSAYMYVSARQRDRIETENTLNRMEQITLSQLGSLETLALGLAEQATNSANNQAAFAAQDRELLTQLNLPTFKALQKDFAVRQYQFFLPPATSFLRLHKLEQFGDDLSPIRATFLKMNETQAAVSGPEIGRGGLGVRGVVPVFHKGKYIGGLEVGLDIGPEFLESLKKQYGVEAQLMLEKGAADIATFIPVSEAPGPTENLLFQASTFAEPLYTDASVYSRVLAGESVISTVRANDRTFAVISFPLKDYSDKVIGVLDVFVDRTDILAAQSRSLWLTILINLVVMSIGGFVLARLINNTTHPITELTKTVSAIAGGDLQRRAVVQSSDEIGALATAFNSMTSQLQGVFEKLEQRVAERTKSLELAAEVGRSISQVRALDVMLQDAAEIIRSRFDLYYTQVYLTDPSQNTLILQSGTGIAGAELVSRGHRLPIDASSINGRAVVEKRSVVIPDTATSTSFRPNPLLPSIRSEMAVPLIAGEKVVGVLDLQSDQAGVLNQDILSSYEALAGQLAIAIQNANLLTETEQARAEVEAQSRRLVRRGWEDHLDAIHRPEQTGFVFDGNQITPLAAEPLIPANSNAVTAPIAITGEALGALVVELDAERQSTQIIELINIVAHQVAQQIENLRLLESAERYRSEAEAAARQNTIEGWQKYVASRGEELGYLYDTKEVQPLSQSQPPSESAMTLPMRAGEEIVGRVAVMGVDAEDSEAVELASAVADRLGAHIENLRLLEETKRGQLELNKRASQLAAVAEISYVSARELDIQKLLETVVQLTQRKFGLYHAHVFLYREQSNELRIAACGWKEGDLHEGTHGTAHIPLNQEQSIVARAARTRQPVIANDVHSEPGWLSNPLLPDTASEMAVPLLIGDQLLGVLDVQSDQLRAFTAEDASIQTTLASQVATAVQNARSFAQAQQQAERESTLNIINQKIQSATSVEAVLQIAARELGHALGAPLTIAQLGMKAHSGDGGNNR